MEIAIQEFKHCDLIAVKGRVDSFTSSQLAQAFEASHKKGQYKIVLDMKDLNYMSSAGFRALLVAQRTCKRYNRGEVVLASVPKQIMESFELTGFTPLFKFFESDTEAVGSF